MFTLAVCNDCKVLGVGLYDSTSDTSASTKFLMPESIVDDDEGELMVCARGLFNAQTAKVKAKTFDDEGNSVKIGARAFNFDIENPDGDFECDERYRCTNVPLVDDPEEGKLGDDGKLSGLAKLAITNKIKVSVSQAPGDAPCARRDFFVSTCTGSCARAQRVIDDDDDENGVEIPTSKFTEDGKLTEVLAPFTFSPQPVVAGATLEVCAMGNFGFGKRMAVVINENRMHPKLTREQMLDPRADGLGTADACFNRFVCARYGMTSALIGGQAGSVSVRLEPEGRISNFECRTAYRLSLCVEGECTVIEEDEGKVVTDKVLGTKVFGASIENEG